MAHAGSWPFDPKRQREAPSTREVGGGGCSMPTGGRRFIGAPCVSPQGVSEQQCVLSYDDQYFDVCTCLCFDLHME